MDGWMDRVEVDEEAQQKSPVIVVNVSLVLATEWHDWYQSANDRLDLARLRWPSRASANKYEYALVVQVLRMYSYEYGSGCVVQ